MKKRYLLVVIVVMLLILVQSNLAFATTYATILDNEQGDQVARLDTNNYTEAVNYLTSGPGYKGHTYDGSIIAVPAVRFGYGKAPFDPRATQNWVGDGYTPQGVYIERVYQLQLSLAYIGYNAWDNVDGYWGSRTKTWVKTYQYTRSLASDGIAGYSTWMLLSDD